MTTGNLASQTAEGVGVVGLCLAPSLLSAPLILLSACCRDVHLLWDSPAPQGTCSLESLWFYYDDDDQLQCVCVDEPDEEEGLDWEPLWSGRRTPNKRIQRTA